MSELEAPRREAAFFRRLAHWGALKGPRPFVRLSPAPIGATFGLLLPEVRARIVRNLRRVHGPRRAWIEQADALATLANYAACFTEAIASAREDVTPQVRVCGEERLRMALEQGGVVLATAHIGPWELTAQLFGRALSADVVLVMQPEADAAARRVQDDHRDARGLRVLHIGGHPTDALPLIAHLKRGGVAALQLDRAPPSGRTLSASLFSAPFALPEGPFRLASLAGATLVPVFAKRLGFFDYELTVSEPVSLPRRPSPRELAQAAERVATALQTHIQASPTQWFHFADD